MITISAILVSSLSRQESHSCLRWWAPDLEWGRDASGDGRAGRLGFGRQFGPGVPGIGAIRRGVVQQPCRYVSALACFAICCGYEDADDLDHLRSDPAFKLACGRLPDTGPGFCVPNRRLSRAGEFAADCAT